MSKGIWPNIDQIHFSQTLVKWVPGSRRDPAKIPGANRDPTGIPPRWPVFPARSFPGKIPAAYLGKNPAEKSVLAGIPPRKKLFSGILARILQGSKIVIAFAART